MGVLQKGLDVIECFLSDDVTDLSLAEISAASGIDKGTAYRIASLLVKRGYLRQQQKRGKYSLGMKYLDFSGILKKHITIRSVAIPYLSRLCHQVNESIILALWDGKEATLAATIHSGQILGVTVDEGTRFPLHGTSAGKIFLSQMTPEELKSCYGDGKLRAYTSNTLTQLVDLEAQLDFVRKNGIAFDNEEAVAGVSGVSAAIKNSEGKAVAAVGVLGPALRMNTQEIIPHIKKCAEEISHALGYKNKV